MSVRLNARKSASCRVRWQWHMGRTAACSRSATAYWSGGRTYTDPGAESGNERRRQPPATGRYRCSRARQAGRYRCDDGRPHCQYRRDRKSRLCHEGRTCVPEPSIRCLPIMTENVVWRNRIALAGGIVTPHGGGPMTSTWPYQPKTSIALISGDQKEAKPL